MFEPPNCKGRKKRDRLLTTRLNADVSTGLGAPTDLARTCGGLRQEEGKVAGPVTRGDVFPTLVPRPRALVCPRRLTEPVPGPSVGLRPRARSPGRSDASVGKVILGSDGSIPGRKGSIRHPRRPRNPETSGVPTGPPVVSEDPRDPLRWTNAVPRVVPRSDGEWGSTSEGKNGK